MKTPIPNLRCIAVLGCLWIATAPAAAQTANPPAVPQQPRQLFRVVEQMPQFNGDILAYLNKNIRYPKQALKDGVDGRAVVQFIVTETGAVIEPKVVRSSGHAGLDEEAVRVVGAMPPWKPGKQNGHPVSVYYDLPVSFHID